MIAQNAQPIIDARLRGLKPEGLVLVSMSGHIAVQNMVVHAAENADYDWRWVHGLEICVYVDEQIDWVQTVKAIAKQRPTYLAIWNRTHQWGADVYLVPTASDVSKPVRQWGYELVFSPWHAFQNNDFVACRTYERDENGVPYAVDP